MKDVKVITWIRYVMTAIFVCMFVVLSVSPVYAEVMPGLSDANKDAYESGGGSARSLYNIASSAHLIEGTSVRTTGTNVSAAKLATWNNSISNYTGETTNVLSSRSGSSYSDLSSGDIVYIYDSAGTFQYAAIVFDNAIDSAGDCPVNVICVDNEESELWRAGRATNAYSDLFMMDTIIPSGGYWMALQTSHVNAKYTADHPDTTPAADPDEPGGGGSNPGGGGNQSGGGGKSNNKKDVEAASQQNLSISMYSVQTALTSYVNEVVGINGNNYHDANLVENPNSVGNAGAYVGYGDPDANFYSLMTSPLTVGASSSTYGAWLGVTVPKNSDNGNSVYAYTRFGRVLADMGLDNTSYASNANGHGIFGIFALAAYVAAEAIPKMFYLAFKLLQTLNPFILFSGMHRLAVNWFPTGSGAFSEVVDFVSKVMDVLVHRIALMAALPMLLAITVAEVFLLRKKSVGRGLTLFAVRVAAVLLLLPIAACLYTAVIDDLVEITSTNVSVSQMAASTFVDFEAWSENSRLAVPSGAYIESAPNDAGDTTANGSTTNMKVTDVEGGVASAESMKRLRNTAFAINKANVDGFSNLTSISGATVEHFSLSGNVWNANQVAPQITNADEDIGFLGINSVGDDLSTTSSVLDMLARYWTGDNVSAANYNASVTDAFRTVYSDDLGRAIAASNAGTSTQNDKIVVMFDMTNEDTDWLERSENENNAIWQGNSSLADGGESISNALHYQWADKAWNIFNDGTLKSNHYNPLDMMRFTSTAGKKGLSTLSMYNYLCTTFDETSIIVYSPNNVVSNNTRLAHDSVNLVGSGVLKIALGANYIVILGVLAIIAFCFTFGMVLKVFSKFTKLLMAVPGMMLGVLKSIAQFVTYFVGMVLEIILSMVLYIVVSDLFVVVATLVEEIAASSDFANYGMIIFRPVMNVIMQAMPQLSEAGALAVIIDTVLVIVLFSFVMKYRRAWLRFRLKVSELLWRYLTLPEFMLMYEAYLNGTLQHKQRSVVTSDWLHGLLQDLSFA